MHHIGLASEEPYKSLTENIVSTNVIFLYLIAANALVASNTKAQALFLAENPGIGSLYEQYNVEQLATILQNYSSNPRQLNPRKTSIFKVGAKEKFSWEIEKEIL
jgi:hypothetical protein